MKLNKRARDNLKEQGLWKVKDDPKPLTGVEAFVAGAMNAPQNQVPIPRVVEPPPMYLEDFFTPDHRSIRESFDESMAFDGFDEIVEEIYPRYDDFDTPVGNYGKNFLFALARRVIDTSEVQETSQSQHVPEVTIPAQVAPFLSPFGGFDRRGETVRVLDPSGYAKSLLWQALSVTDEASVYEAFERLWLPSTPECLHTKHVVAHELVSLYAKYGVTVSVGVLMSTLFSGTIPNVVVNNLESLPLAWHEALLKLFWSYKTDQQFFKFVAADDVLSLLRAMNLDWPNPQPSHLCFGKSFRDVTKMACEDWVYPMSSRKTQLLMSWMDFKSMYPKGSPSQVYRVDHDDLVHGYAPVGQELCIDSFAECLVTRWGSYFSVYPVSRKMICFDTSAYSSEDPRPVVLSSSPVVPPTFEVV